MAGRQSVPDQVCFSPVGYNLNCCLPGMRRLESQINNAEVETSLDMSKKDVTVACHFAGFKGI